MKRWTIALLALVFTMAMPMASMAMSHESHEGHDHGKSEEMMHKGHEMEDHGDMEHEDHGKHKGHEMHMDHAKDKAHDMHKGHEKEDHGDMEHEDHGKHKGHEMHMDHAKDKAHDMHKGHEAGDHSGLVAIGEGSAMGVKAVAKVKTYDDATVASMAKMGMTGTHHLMVFFTDENTGEEITAGTVAVKVKGPGEEKSKAVKLMQMGSGFGADIALTEKGHYDIEVGSKLQDGKKRKYEFHQMVE